MWPGALIVLFAFLPPTQAPQDEAIELAKEAVEAKESGTSSLRVRQAEPVQWPDTSLGCAEEGMMYAQVITPGYRVLIQAEARLYTVHVGGGRAVICREPIDRSTGRFPKKVPLNNEPDTQGEVRSYASAGSYEQVPEKAEAILQRAAVVIIALVGTR